MFLPYIFCNLNVRKEVILIYMVYYTCESYNAIEFLMCNWSENCVINYLLIKLTVVNYVILYI